MRLCTSEFFLYHRHKPSELIHCSRILIFQDHRDLWVTIAEYEKSYLDYLHQEPSTSLLTAGFLCMHWFGP